ncbi:AAA family ATPase [Hymenobacter sp. BT664]|uniref:AAA family ATPase n=1 Tax=Hymenobacter montanus TaxID=2771359 RepID=A0A927GII7_9BACT|nr:AAA family ATPase [Hymenobacter montanus]MBD2767410.1 AAA family ATPase [Hymenobacter montanus]
MSHRGATYRKTDLQIHSPRDANWVGGRPDDSRAELTEHEIITKRIKWAAEFVDACVAKGIQVAALTDHHEGVYCWYVWNEVERRKNQGVDLWFMPGMELTCRDSVQALILFDHDIPRALFDKARNALGLKADVEENKRVGIEVKVMNHDLEKLQIILDADPELVGRFIIMPNVTADGYKHIVRDGFHKRFAEMPYVGLYLDKKYPTDLRTKAYHRVTGQTVDWGGARGIISTSDSRIADFSDLGAFPTWLKLAAPTAESLRQAMLAADSRISYTATKPPTLYIESVSVKNAAYLHLDEALHFSPQFSSVIGGRGSGKSTLLEYVRYALGISALEGRGSDWDPTYERRKALLEATLNASSEVEVVLIQDGVSIHITRSHANPDRIVMQVGGQEKSISMSDAKKLFPIQAYSQGELSHLGEGKAEKRLFELITAPDQASFDGVNKAIKDIDGELRRLLGQAVEYWRLEGQRRQIDAQLITTKAGIDSIKKGLGGLDSGTQDILDRHQIVGQTSRWLKNLINEYTESQGNLVSAFETHLAVSEKNLTILSLPLADAAQLIAGALREELTAVTDAFRIIIAASEAFEQKLEINKESWKSVLNEHNVQYSVALSQAEKFTADLQRLTFLEQQQLQQQANRDELTAKMEDLQAYTVEITRQSGDYSAQQALLRQLTSSSAAKLVELTNGQASAKLSLTDDISEMVDAIATLFKGSGVRSERINKLVDTLKGTDAVAVWWRLLNEVLDAFRWKISGLSMTEARPTLPILDETIDAGGLGRFCDMLSVERVSQALTAVSRPRVKLMHKQKGREVEFSQASQGEKATILLNVLMRQTGGPLLLDQPEEGLDNRIIGDIVSAIHAAKSQKQLIFATHNANLVVNGDAELVVDLNAGSINEIGAIDLPTVRDAITQTMEGGKNAFELRRLKYNF